MAAIEEAGISVAISMAVAIVQGCVVVASALAGVMPSVDSMAAGALPGAEASMVVAAVAAADFS